jgi:ribosome-associated toxin RatA of RatAB toxin-antitoxin module
MAMVEKSVLIERSAQQMFDLVDNVEDYPGFLPWCSQTRVEFRDEKKTIATLHINYFNMKSHFTTENEKEIPFRMSIKLVDGPFRRLEGMWHFKPLAENACKVEFHLSYEFSSKMFDKMIGPVFSQIINTFVDAFIRRADAVYGVSNA